MSFVKKYYPMLIVISILFCAFYSLGYFDRYLVFEDVLDKKYTLGDFSYTGKLKNGKFTDTGLIELSNGSMIFAQFDDGIFCGKFIYISNGASCFEGSYKDGVITNVKDGGLYCLKENL